MQQRLDNSPLTIKVFLPQENYNLYFFRWYKFTYYYENDMLFYDTQNNEFQIGGPFDLWELGYSNAYFRISFGLLNYINVYLNVHKVKNSSCLNIFIFFRFRIYYFQRIFRTKLIYKILLLSLFVNFQERKVFYISQKNSVFTS